MDGYRFFFYNKEGNEPPHIHVTKGDCEAKYWLEPDLELSGVEGCTPRERKRTAGLVRDTPETFKAKWHEFFISKNG